ncbi:MAG: hypothetical protein WCW17_03900, partial [Patescibacteria group bacterium]
GEPYFQGLPDTKKFFNRFLNGEPSIGRTHFTFAESMFMSTEWINWKNILIGDPLYTLSDDPSTDNSAPKLENVSTAWDGNNLIIKWDNLLSSNGSPEVSYGFVDYGTTLSYGSTQSDHSDDAYFNTEVKHYLSQHIVTIPNLNSTHKYYLKIRALDPANNQSEQTLEIN